MVQLSPSSTHSVGSSGPRSEKKDHLSAFPPATMEVYRVAATARSFLLSLLEDLPQVNSRPYRDNPLTYSLVHISQPLHCAHREAAVSFP